MAAAVASLIRFHQGAPDGYTRAPPKTDHRGLVALRSNQRTWLGSSISLAACMDPCLKNPRCSSSHNALWERFHRLCEDGHLNQALEVLVLIERHEPVPVGNLYSSFLKACNDCKAPAHVMRMHPHLVRLGLDHCTCLGDYLVHSMANCGSLEHAVAAFMALPCRNILSWNAIISAYLDSGECQKVLLLYQSMQEESTEPNEFTFVYLFKACGCLSYLEQGISLHGDCERKGFDSMTFVANTLISMYSKCGSIANAEKAFKGLALRDTVSWNAMLSAYIEHGEAEKAMGLIRQMHNESVSPSCRTYVLILQMYSLFADRESCKTVGEKVPECFSFTSLNMALAIHDIIVTKGFDSDLYINSNLLCMYREFGSSAEAEYVFLSTPTPTVVSWTVMLSVYVEQSNCYKALRLYRQMLEVGVTPNDWTFVCTLQICCLLADMDEQNGDKQPTEAISFQLGQVIHVEALRKGPNLHVFVGNSLINMYGKCRNIREGENVFDLLHDSDVVSWNSLLSAYVEYGQEVKALQLYTQMLREGVSPNKRTYATVIQACYVLANKEPMLQVMCLDVAKALFTDVRMYEFDSSVFVGNTLMSLYGECGSIVEAERVFNHLPERDIISWNTMIAAYIMHNQAEKALSLYKEMRSGGLALEDGTLVLVLQACSLIGNLELCWETHYAIVSAGHDLSLPLATALIHCYGCCGSIKNSQAVFDALQSADVVAWSALIAGYARCGDCQRSLEVYGRMQMAGVKPTGVTFSSLLAACSHAGLVDKGFDYFQSMVIDFGILPETEHYIGLLNLPGRAGDLRRIEDLLLRLPTQCNATMWSCLLSACQKHGNIEQAREAFNHAVDLEPEHGYAYVLMSNLNADPSCRTLLTV